MISTGRRTPSPPLNTAAAAARRHLCCRPSLLCRHPCCATCSLAASLAVKSGPGNGSESPLQRLGNGPCCCLQQRAAAAAAQTAPPSTLRPHSCTGADARHCFCCARLPVPPRLLVSAPQPRLHCVVCQRGGAAERQSAGPEAAAVAGACAGCLPCVARLSCASVIVAVGEGQQRGAVRLLCWNGVCWRPRPVMLTPLCRPLLCSCVHMLPGYADGRGPSQRDRQLGAYVVGPPALEEVRRGGWLGGRERARGRVGRERENESASTHFQEGAGTQCCGLAHRPHP